MTPGRLHSCPTCARTFASGEVHCPFDGARLATAERQQGDPLIGSVVGGRYLVQSRLGAGGMGIVYRAQQQQLERAVALKVLSSRFNEDQQVEERFRTEAKAASQLVNPHTVTVFDFGSAEDGSLFIAMQLVEGESLRKTLSRGPLPLRTALSIGAQVCDSLSEAHGRKLIHRDIKPDNIMLRDTSDGEPFAVVLDFGLARFTDTARLTATNNVVGTPAYMSPEQARGVDGLGAPADMYAVGVVLFEMIAGKAPFVSSDAAALLFKHAFDAPPRMIEVNPGLVVPEALQQLVSELLAKAPSDRPQSASSVRQRLIELRDRAPRAEIVRDPDEVPTAKTVTPPVMKGAAEPSLTTVFKAPSHASAAHTDADLTAAGLQRSKAPLIAGAIVVLLAIAAAVMWPREPEHVETPVPVKTAVVAPPPPPAPIPVVPPPAPPPTPVVVAPPPAPAPVEAERPRPKPKPTSPAGLSREDLAKLKL